MCGALVRVGGFDMAWAGRDESGAGRTINPLAWSGRGTERLRWARAEASAIPLPGPLRRGESLVLNDTAADGRTGPWGEDALSWGFGSLAGLPLKAAGEILGFLSIYASNKDAFPSKEMDLLRELSTNVGWGLSGLRARKEEVHGETGLSTQRIQQEVLISLLDQALGTAFLPVKLERALGELQRLPWTDRDLRGAVFLAEESGLLEIAAERGLPPAVREGCATVPPGVCLCGRAFQQGEAIHTREADSRHDRGHPGIPDHGHHVIPIRGNERQVLGVLTLHLAPEHRHSREERQFLEAVATVLGILVERSRAEEAVLRHRRALAGNRRLSTLGQIGSSLAHQLRQPLTAAVNYGVTGLDLLDREDTVETARALLEKGLEQVQRAQSLVEDLRRFLSQGEPQREATDPQELIGQIRPLLEEMTQGSGLEIACELAPGLPTVLCDPLQIQEVVLNLARNALEAMSEECSGQVTIRFVADEQVMIEVADEGPGLPETLKRDPVQPFFTTKADGMGLGLPICQAIVQSHGGSFWAQANVPRGTVFRFTLPRAQRDGIHEGRLIRGHGLRGG